MTDNEEPLITDIDVWFNSELINNLDILEPLTVKQVLTEDQYKYWQPLVTLNVLEENYLKLLELAEFLLITNMDKLFDKIYQMGNFIERLKNDKVNNITLNKFIDLIQNELNLNIIVIV